MLVICLAQHVTTSFFSLLFLAAKNSAARNNRLMKRICHKLYLRLQDLVFQNTITFLRKTRGIIMLICTDEIR